MNESAARSDLDSVGTFFQNTKTGQWVPRSVFVDLEPSVIGKINRTFYMIHTIINLCLYR